MECPEKPHCQCRPVLERPAGLALDLGGELTKREEMDSSRAGRWHWERTCGPLVPDLVMKSGRRQSEEALRTPTPLPTQGRHCRSPRRARTLLSITDMDGIVARPPLQPHPPPTPCRATRSLSPSVTFCGSLWPEGH